METPKIIRPPIKSNQLLIFVLKSTFFWVQSYQNPIKTPQKKTHMDPKHRVCNMIFLGESYGYGSKSFLSSLFTPKYVYFIWLVVYLPLRKYESQLGRIIPYIYIYNMKWKITNVLNISKPPTSFGCSSPQIWQFFAADASPEHPWALPRCQRWANCRRPKTGGERAQSRGVQGPVDVF